MEYSTSREIRKIKAGQDSPRDADPKLEYRHGWIPVTAVGNIDKFIELSDSEYPGVLVKQRDDKTWGIYSDKDADNLIKSYKTQNGATNHADRIIQADIKAESKREFEERLPKVRRERIKHEKAQREREAERLAENAQSFYRPAVPISEENKGKKNPRRKFSSVKIKEGTTLVVPRKTTQEERKRAVTWANKELDGSERQYADLILRLSKKGLSQNPDSRRQQAEKRDMKATRLIQIEQNLYREMFPQQGKPAGPKLGGTNTQKRVMTESGARKSYPLPNISTRINDNHDVLFKANKGTERGKWIVVTPNGTISRRPSNTQALNMQKESKDFVKAALLKGRETAITRTGQRVNINSAAWKREVEEVAALQPTADEIAAETKEAKIKRAKEWAREVGLDETDSYWWSVYNNDRSLLKSQGGPGASPQDTLSDTPEGPRGRKKKEGTGEFPESTQRALDAIEERIRAAERAESGEEDESDDEEIEEEEIEEAPEPPKKSIKVPRRVAQKIKAEKEKTSSKKPKSKKETAEPKTSRAKRKEKREAPEFEEQSGLPLSNKPANKDAVKEISYPDVPIPTVRPATNEDMFRLFGTDPETGEPKPPPKGRENIRVPVGKMPGGYGDFTYLYDHHERKARGKVTTDKKNYSQSHNLDAARRKFARIAEVSKHITKLDSSLKKDAKTDDAAGAVMLMRVLAMRPSSDKGETKLPLRDSKGELVRDSEGIIYGEGIPTFGATTLQRRHVTFDGDTAIISLTGKAAHEINIKTNDPDVVATLRSRLKKKGKPEEKLFNTTPSKATSYIKKAIPIASNKDMRTYVATEIATQTVASINAKNPPPSTVAEFKSRVMDVTETTANQLQHDPKMSKNSYVSPSVFFEWAGNLTEEMDWDLYENPLSGPDRKIVTVAQGLKIRQKHADKEAAKAQAAKDAAKTSRSRRKK